MKRILQLKLKYAAKLILAKYKPDVIGITGSVGKTSTKEAIYKVLSSKNNVRRNVKNYNNEFGLPLTIIGADSPGRNIFGWFLVFFKALKLILFKDKNYPQILVLEMGIDHPGDMKYLNSIVECKFGVVTTVGTVHAENFDSLEELRKEKAELIKNVLKGGWSIINYDDESTRKMINESKAKVLTYGLDAKAQIKAQEINFSFQEEGLKGLSFKMLYNGSVVPMMLPNVLSRSSVYNALAAAAVGVAYGMNLIDISTALRDFLPPQGRMNLIPGVKNTIIVDDSYNAEPKSMKAALETLKMIPKKDDARKFAVLGDMLELGKYSEEKHREIGQEVVVSDADKLIVVGERARDIARGAESAGMKRDDIFQFSNSEEAGKFIQNRIKQNDIILVKGSQGARMEKIVKEIMAEPLRAPELLVRQGKSWGN